MTAVRDRTAWLQGGDAVCVRQPAFVHRVWRFVLLGPPGVGKGTQAEFLSRSLGTCALSTGEIFRAARGQPAAPGSPMAKAQQQMEHGELVSDETVIALIAQRGRCLHCRGGFMLDGFPRTLPQARALDDLLAAEKVPLDAVISYELPLAELVTRLAGRRVCPACKAVYHLPGRPPRKSGICDQCGSELVQRADDHPEAVHVRLDAYAAATTPLTDYYRAKGLLMPIDASGRAEDILERTLHSLALLVLEPAPAQPRGQPPPAGHV